MKKWIFSFALTLSLSVNSTTDQDMLMHNHAVAPRTFAAHEAEYVHPDSVVVGRLIVKGMEIKGFDAESLKKLNKAFAVLEEVVNSEEFKNRVINFKNKKGQRAFASNQGLSNEEIYEKFMEGRETLQPNTQGEMNYFLKLYYSRWSRVIGYTAPTTNVININWKFFRNYDPNEVAGNLAHEWIHKIGFDHSSASEHDSVPYALCYIVEEMAAKLLTSPTRIAFLQ